MNGSVVFAALLGFTIQAFAAVAQQTTPTATRAEVRVTTEVEASKQPWGEMLVGNLKWAPYPDDTRTTGLQGRESVIPYEGHYDDNSVVFLLPEGFKPTKSPDLIVYFHGHKGNARKTVGEYKIGEQLRNSGRNAILIIPQGPKDAADSGCGKLEKPGVFEKFIGEAMNVLEANGKLPKGARPGNIILGAHSGGYKVLGMILRQGGLARNIREAWLFDASYGQLDDMTAPFLEAKSERVFRSIFTDHLAPENYELMSNFGLRGKRVVMIEDERITTAGTTKKQFDAQKYHSPAGAPGKDELPYILEKEPVLFLHTKLPHGSVVWGSSYLERFAHSSPHLKPLEAKQSGKPETEGP